jgi:hypothetical protein
MKKNNLGKRPKCIECGSDCQFLGSYRKDGTPIFRKLCGSCHGKAIAKKRGMKSILHVLAKNKGVKVSDYVKTMNLATAKNQGFNTYSQYLSSIHPYKRYRKVYCENAKGEYAGWLAFKCTTRIVAPHLQLDTDHIDGNPKNNAEDNLMTLCKCCHAIKTNMFLDYKTPGRKGRKNVQQK